MLGWIQQFLDVILSVVPRLVKIRSTHRGVKWAFCGPPREMLPGLRIVWPIFDEWDVMVVARQTDDLPPQTLTLADGTTVAVAGLAIYRVADVVAAYGEKNWDVTATIRDLGMSAVAKVITSIKREELQDLEPINARITDLVRELSEEYGVSIQSCSLVEVSVARTIRHLGIHLPTN